MDGIAYQLGQGTAVLTIVGATVIAVALAGYVLRYMARLTGMDRDSDRELAARLSSEFRDIVAAVVEHQHTAKVREFEQGLANVLQAAALPARKGSTGEISWPPYDMPTEYETFEQALERGRTGSKPKRKEKNDDKPKNDKVKNDGEPEPRRGRK
jgi:hypothetical protein